MNLMMVQRICSPLLHKDKWMIKSSNWVNCSAVQQGGMERRSSKYTVSQTDLCQGQAWFIKIGACRSAVFTVVTDESGPNSSHLTPSAPGFLQFINEDCSSGNDNWLTWVWTPHCDSMLICLNKDDKITNISLWTHNGVPVNLKTPSKKLLHERSTKNNQPGGVLWQCQAIFVYIQAFITYLKTQKVTSIYVYIYIYVIFMFWTVSAFKLLAYWVYCRLQAPYYRASEHGSYFWSICGWRVKCLLNHQHTSVLNESLRILIQISMHNIQGSKKYWLCMASS